MDPTMNIATSNGLPRPTDDLERAKHDVDEFGYGILTNLIPASEVDRLRGRLDEQARLEREQGVAWLGNGGRGGNTWIGRPKEDDFAPWQAIRTLLNKGRPFVDLAMNPRILGIMRHIFREKEFYLLSTNGLILKKGAVPMVVHTDQQQVNHQSPFPFVANILVTLSDFTAEMGATRVVPRSHKGPLPPVEFDPETRDGRNPIPIDMVTAECPPGSALILEGRTWHSSGWHSSDITRYAISTYYGLPWFRQQDCYQSSLHDDVYDALTDAERTMFGFKTGPFGRMDPRYPGDRINVDVKSPYIPELREGGDKKAIPLGEGSAFWVHSAANAKT
jgi:ectoine hydroxylase-related dioxygenase (phytanoyl-CoA dioxygenase family)